MSLAQAYIDAGRLEDAVRVIRLGLPAHPDEAAAHLLLGRALLRMGELPEAVVALDSARQRCPEDAAVQQLYKRARLVLSEQDTSVQIDEERTDRSLAAGVAPDARGAAPSEGWEELESAWEQVLDANSDERPDPISDLREPSYSAAAIDVDLPPLGDPLAQGMPPLPEEEAWPSSSEAEPPTAQAPGAEVAALVRAASAEPAVSEPAEPAEPAPAEPAVSEPAEPAPAEPAVSEPAKPAPAEPAVSEPAKSAKPAEPAEPAKPAEPDEEPADDIFAAAGFGSTDSPPATPSPVSELAVEEEAHERVGVESLPPAFAETMPLAALSADEAPLSPPEDPVDLLRASLGQDGMPGVLGQLPAVEGQLRPVPTLPTVRPPSRLKPMLLGVVIMLLLVSGGAVISWYVMGGRAVRAALTVAREARLSVDAGQSGAAIESLRRAMRYRRASVRLAEEAALLAALRALVHGDAVREVPAAGGKRWSGNATRAVIALARNAPQALGSAPKDARDRRLHQILEAWAAWVRGESQKALELLGSTGDKAPDDGLSRLLSGYIRLERGEQDLAERSFGDVLKRQPGSRLAQLALAWLLLERDADKAVVDELMDRPVSTPATAVWQALLEVERARRRGQADPVAAASALVDTLAGAPNQRALLTVGTRLLLRLCRFGSARELVVRLSPSGTSPKGTALLQGELALGAGLDGQAARLLALASDTSRGRRLALRALLYTKQLKQARALLERVDKGENGAALALYLDPRADQGTLTVDPAAARSTDFSLTLAAAALARDDPALALRIAQRLRDEPVIAPRARWIVAQSLYEQGAREEALVEANSALRRCPGFAAAQELVGRLHLEQSAYSVAEEALRRAIEAGRQTNDALLGRARALAELSRVDEADELVTQAEKGRAAGPGLEVARAQVLLARGRPQACLAALGRAGDDSLAARVLRARALVASGQFAEAELVLLDLRRQRPGQPLPELMLGLLLQRQQSPEARGHLVRATKLAAAKPLHRRTLARAHVGLAREAAGPGGGPSAAGLRQLAASFRADERYPPAFVLLGRWRLSQRKWADARRALEAAVKLDPRDASPVYLLAQAQRGDPAAQRQSYAAFLRLEPSGKRAEAARRALAQLK